MTARMDGLGGAGEKVLACALVAGDPHVEATLEYMDALVRAGVDVIELLLPFSDPFHHGRVVQRACSRALREEIGWREMAEIGEGFRGEHNDTPVFVSSYYNRVFAHGLEQTSRLLRDAGFDGMMIPDLPWNESESLEQALADEGLELVMMLASTSPRERVETICADATSLVVWSGHAGGEITASDERYAESLRHAQACTSAAVIAAMQISSEEEAVRIARHADGIIVGSSIIWIVEGRGEVDERILDFVGSLRDAVDDA